MKAVEKAQPPTKGVRPRLEGVPGALVDSAPPDVLFGYKNLRTSPYDPLLLQLQAAGPGKFLKFDDLRARPAIIGRSKKLNIKVVFGEQGNTLWVTLAKAELRTDGRVEELPAKPSMSELVVAAISAKRTTAGEIVSWMRSNGAPGIGITQVDGLLSNLHRAGKIRMSGGKPGADQPDRWSLAA